MYKRKGAIATITPNPNLKLKLIYMTMLYQKGLNLNLIDLQIN